MAVCGVDVHDGYQAGISFPTLFAQGYRFAAIKLTEGTGYVRSAAASWIRAARDAGLVPGAYHWLTSGDGAAQARWFHQHVVDAGGPDGMLIQLDCEDDGYGPQIAAWTAEWHRLTDRYPFLIYSAAWWWPRTGGFNGSAMTPYLWHARYLGADADSVPDDPAAFAARIPTSWWVPGYGGWSQATLIQFTSKGDAGGLANNVDLNVYRGTLDELRSTLMRPTGGGTMGTWDDSLPFTVPKETALAGDPAYGKALSAPARDVAWYTLVRSHIAQRAAQAAEGKVDQLLARPAAAPVALTDEDLARLVVALKEALLPDLLAGLPAVPDVQAIAAAVLDEQHRRDAA